MQLCLNRVREMKSKCLCQEIYFDTERSFPPSVVLFIVNKTLSYVVQYYVNTDGQTNRQTDGRALLLVPVTACVCVCIPMHTVLLRWAVVKNVSVRHWASARRRRWCVDGEPSHCISHGDGVNLVWTVSTCVCVTKIRQCKQGL